MDETQMDIILSATDDASDTFEAVQDAAESMGETIGGAGEEGTGGMEELGKATEDTKEEADETTESFSNLGSILETIAGAEIFTQLADALWDAADKAGTFEDSLMRAKLEAEGAGIDVNAMTDAVSELSATTGRAGGEIRESFIKATARGITDLDSFKTMMEGAGAQATLLGTDIQSMGDKFSGMAQRSRLMEKGLASTGITVEELGNALGMQGATMDEINEKWETMDANERAAALGMAATMNEGEKANEAYKESWAGLQAQVDIAKGRLERLAGEVLLPILIPALEAAARVLDWLGDQISSVLDGPLGGLVTVIGGAAAAFALLVPAVMAVQGAMVLFEASLMPAIAASWALIAPWLPFIAIGAAIVAIVYEVGKAFGWWSDASSMMDAIWAGMQRLWSAFINHPDVQGLINGIRQAWAALAPYIQRVIDWVKSFFNESNGSKFDPVRALIDSISDSWNRMTAPIRLVIKVVQTIIKWFTQAGNKGKATVNRIRAAFAALPGQIRSGLSHLVSIITKPFQNAYNRITGIVGQIKGAVHNITSVNISGVTSKLTQPFVNAYNKISGWVDKIKSKASSIGNLNIGGMFGGYDLAYGGADLIAPSTSYNREDLKITQDINLSLDLRNVPNGVSEDVLYDALTSKEFINALVTNSDFQSLDAKVKGRINAKARRARGV